MRWINELVLNETELKGGKETSLREERKRILLDKLDQNMRDLKMSCGFWGEHRVNFVNHSLVSVRVQLGRYGKLPNDYLVEARPYFGGGFGAHVTGGGIGDDGTRESILNTFYALFDQMVDWESESEPEARDDSIDAWEAENCS